MKGLMYFTTPPSLWAKATEAERNAAHSVRLLINRMIVVL